MFYLKFTKLAFKNLTKLDPETGIAILSAISKLTHHPQDVGKPLTGELKGKFRLRVGDYRVIYEILNDQVIILQMGHRREVYG
jgi:mRNA interferase RelE/StbE